jgi:hypothetical protein
MARHSRRLAREILDEQTSRRLIESEELPDPSSLD